MCGSYDVVKIDGDGGRNTVVARISGGEALFWPGGGKDLVALSLSLTILTLTRYLYMCICLHMPIRA
jgi:hypothetical protein